MGGLPTETWIGIASFGLAILGVVGAADRRRAADVERLRKELEQTYMRRDVYIEQQKPMRRQLARVERLVELIYRNMRGLPPIPGLAEDDEKESSDGS